MNNTDSWLIRLRHDTMNMERSNYLSIKDAALRLAKTEKEVRELCRAGVLPGAYKNPRNGRWCIPATDVSTFEQLPIRELTNSRNSRRTMISHAGLIGILVFAFALISAVADLPGAYQQIRDWLYVLGISTPFPKARGDDILIIVTEFTGANDLDPETRIYRALYDRIAVSRINRARVERLDANAPTTEEEAIAIGERYDATLVIWGTVDRAGMEPHYTVVKNQESIVTRPELGVTIAADLPTFSAYIAEGAANEYEYLMLFSTGQIAYFSGNSEQAIQLFGDAIAIDLDANKKNLGLETVHYYRAYAYRLLERLPEALADINESIKLDGQDAEKFTTRGNFYHEMGEFEAALADHNRAIELDPEVAGYYVNRGNAYSDMGQDDKALADYERALEIEPKLALAYANRGVVYDQKGQYDIALADYNRAIEIDPSYAIAYFMRGQSFYNQKKFTEAISDFGKAASYGLEDDIVFYYRGDSYHALKNYQAALEDYNRAIEINPEFIVAYNNRGNVYHSLGDLDDALIDFNRAIELEPKYALAYYNRGALYETRGDSLAAIADFNRAIELASENDWFVETARWRIEVLGGTPP